MLDAMKGFGYLIIAGLMIWVFLILDYPQYECVEYKQGFGSHPDNILTTGKKLYFYQGGGVYEESTLSSFKIPHKIVEGNRFISYLRSNGLYSYKIDKNDLTYHDRLSSSDGQCKKIGFLAKYQFSSFSGLDSKEFDY